MMISDRNPVEAAIEYIQDLFRDNYGGHDAGHTLRVYHNAMILAENEAGCDKEIIALAALLHDVDDHKLFHTENNANARSFLEGAGISREKIERICEAVNSVSFSKNRGKHPETLEGKIVQDADRLDALGAIGIARTFSFGGEHGRPMEDSIRHFHEKLLLLKDGMNTASARKIADQRHQFMVSFLVEYSEETSCGEEE